MSTLELKTVVKSFDDTPVIHGVNLQVANGEFVVFVGPSGCGKSTLLRIIAGLDSPTSGALLIDGQDVTSVDAAQRGCAMVFQSYALYPHMTVYDNMAFGLENLKVPKATIEHKVHAAAELLQLSPLLRRRPTQLSGGQRQRVAIGRSIVREPKLFLFDEPLSNLDAELRVSMRAEIRDLHDRLGATMIYVTHDQVEAMTMADKIVVLRAGRIEQVGAPLDLYNRPDNTFVAGFIGSPRINLIAAALLADAPTQALKQAHTIGIRPEHVQLAPDRGDLQFAVQQVEQLGQSSLLHGQVEGSRSPGPATDFSVVLQGQTRLKRGDVVGVKVPRELMHCFDVQGQRLAS